MSKLTDPRVGLNTNAINEIAPGVPGSRVVPANKLPDLSATYARSKTVAARIAGQVDTRNLMIPTAPLQRQFYVHPPVASLGAASGGGTFAAGTFFWMITAVDANGNESIVSNELTATLTINQQQVLNWTAAPAGAAPTGYKVYRGTSKQSENVLVTTLGNVLTYTDTGTAGSAGTPPFWEHTGPNTLSPNQSIAVASLMTNGMMTFCRGGNFVTNGGGGQSPTYRTPRAGAGREPFTVMSGYDGSRITFTLTSAPGAYWRLWVDGQYYNNQTNPGYGGGATTYVDLNFGTAKPRQIRLDLTSCDLVSVIMQPTASLWAIQTRGPRCIVIGDSYTGGAGSPPPVGFTAISSWTNAFADVIGWDDVWESGIGGTGWITRNASQTNNYQDRVAADVIGFAPDVVIFYGARNDIGGNTAAQIASAAAATVAAVRAGLPNCLIIVLGPNGNAHPVDGSADATWTPVEQAMFPAVAATSGVITLDTCLPGIFTGTGKAGATTGAGNGDVYIQSDGVHPNQAGSDYLGYRIAQRLIRALANA